MDTPQQKFEGWARVEALGHQTYYGRVTTEYYGNVAMFRVETPARPESTRVIADEQGEYFYAFGNAPKGSTVRYAAAPGSTRLVGAGSIYGITPLEEAEVLAELPERKVLGVFAPDGAAITMDDEIPD